MESYLQKCSGHILKVQGWLHVVDILFGLGLVALSEEIVFRRCARHLLQSYLDDGYALVLATSFLFGAYHWWTGFGNIGAAVVIGGLLMMLHRRSGALWPAVLGHYLADIINFAFDRSPCDPRRTYRPAIRNRPVSERWCCPYFTLSVRI